MNRVEVEILNYATSQSRNKIIFYRDEIPGIRSLDVGLELSQAIYNMEDMEKLPMRASMELSRLFNNAISIHEMHGNYLAIENLGILFEPELKIDISRLLDINSQNNLLFIKWEGEREHDHLYFLTKKNGTKINISNLSHIAI